LTPAEIKEAAKLLFEARTRAVVIKGLPQNLTPANIDDALRIRDELFALLGGQCVGWFLGGTSRYSMVPLPYFAPILPSAMHDSGSAFNHLDFLTFNVDVELGFTFARDIGCETEVSRAADVLHVVDYVYPTLDVMNSQIEKLEAVGWPTVIANNGTDGAIIRGPPVPISTLGDLSSLKARLRVNGREVFSDLASVVMGNPLEAVRWFVGEMMRISQPIPKGAFLSTGSITQPYRACPGDSLLADFGEVGTVSLRYS
jgi:2-keto-4-pentenoate hydratase